MHTHTHEHFEHARGVLSPPAAVHEPPSRATALPLPLPSYSLPLGSPIEALADAAVSSQRTSPAYPEPARRPAHTATSPSGRLHPASERAPKHAFTRDSSHAYTERPSKRARSEHQASPTYGMHQSRPATSHIPGYNVEQMMDAGMRMYQDNRIAASQQSNGGDKMLSDAELLLFFSNVSAHTAQTPPSHAKRWSISQASPPAQPPQQTPPVPLPQPMQLIQSSPPAQPKYEPLSPQAATVVPFDNRPSSAQGAAEVKPPPDPPSFPSDVLDAALAAQTQTPPEETASIIPQAVAQETALVEEPKPKKQQAATKSKPRGSRSTPSASKRKRSTPKSKNPMSTGTSAGPDQLQSPQSLPAEQPSAPAYNDQSSQSHTTQLLQSANAHNRRHSFSISSAYLPSDTSPFASLRAQSVPSGGGEQSTSAPVGDLYRSAQETVNEQPELICAACKSSESEVKVGDGEQWIGCDGCKEWYHYACAGFNSEREVRDVNKFYCDPCRPKFGDTTSRSTDAPRRYNSNLAQRFASPLESTQRLTTPVSMKVSSRLPTTIPNITTSPLSRMET
jgi:F-box/leucine-rich repeat protein 10/11